MLNAPFSGRPGGLICFEPVNAETAVFPRPGLQNLIGVVRTGVIHAQYFDIRHRLLRPAGEGFLQEFRHIVHRNDH